MPTDGSAFPKRKSLRLPEFDYSAWGAYFVTLCLVDNRPPLGSIVNGSCELTPIGQIIKRCWNELTRRYPAIELDAFQIMPDHCHDIIFLLPDNLPHLGPDLVGAGQRPVRDPSVSKIDRLGPDLVGAGLRPARNPSEGKIDRPGADLVGAGLRPARNPSLPDVIRAFKSFSARAVNKSLGRHGIPLWQRNYYERVIRDDRELAKFRRYIETNPQRWELRRAKDTEFTGGS